LFRSLRNHNDLHNRVGVDCEDASACPESAE